MTFLLQLGFRDRRSRFLTSFIGADRKLEETRSNMLLALEVMRQVPNPPTPPPQSLCYPALKNRRIRDQCFSGERPPAMRCDMGSISTCDALDVWLVNKLNGPPHFL